MMAYFFYLLVCFLFFSPSAVSPSHHKSPSLVLVLGAGGVRGFAHIGVIEVLEKANIRPDVIIGSSAGSIIGGLYASEGSIQKIKKPLLAYTKKKVLSQGAVLSGFPRGALTRALACILKKHLKSTTFSELKIPFIATVVDLASGQLVGLDEGNLHKAILASCAIPLICHSIKIGGSHYVDGGLITTIPVLLARKRFPNAFIVAVDVNPKLPKALPKGTFSDTRYRVEVIFSKSGSKEDLAAADFVIDVPVIQSGLNLCHQQKIYEAGVHATRAVLPKLEVALAAQLSK